MQVGRRRRSIGSQRALGRRAHDRPTALDAVLIAIVDRLGRRLRAARRVCRTVVLRLRFDDFSRATRSHTMPQATAQTATILETARGLLRESMPMIQHKGVTLVGIASPTCATTSPIQLALPFDEDRAVALDVALDEVRDRFGSAAITRAVLVGRHPGITMPHLPD